MKISKRVSQIIKSSIPIIGQRVKEMKIAGEYVIDLLVGEPDFDTPDKIKQAGISAINAGFTRYPPTAGFLDLRTAICDKLKKDNGLDYKPSQIVVSCGAKHSLYNIFQTICEPGDEVIIPSPYWNSYPDMVKLAGAKPVIVNTDITKGFKLTPEQFKKTITTNTRAVIINSPSNPTGTVYSRDELEKIAEIAVSRHVCIISDEIYEKLIYDGLEHYSIASLGKDVYNLTITVNGFSKSHSMTGWRLGYLAGPEDIAQAVIAIQGNSTSGASSISQRAAISAFETGEERLKDIVAEYENRRDYIIGELNNIRGISCFKPSGAFYVFCDISESGLGSLEFATQLLERYKVAILPGIGFGWDTHVRISFATGMENIKRGLSCIGKFLKCL